MAHADLDPPAAVADAAGPHPVLRMLRLGAGQEAADAKGAEARTDRRTVGGDLPAVAVGAELVVDDGSAAAARLVSRAVLHVAGAAPLGGGLLPRAGGEALAVDADTRRVHHSLRSMADLTSAQDDPAQKRRTVVLS